MAFEIEPNKLYSLDELESALAGIVTLPTLLDRLGLRDGRVFKGALFGFEILRAAEKAHAFNAKGEPAPPISIAPLARGRRRVADKPLGRFSASDV